MKAELIHFSGAALLKQNINISDEQRRANLDALTHELTNLAPAYTGRPAIKHLDLMFKAVSFTPSDRVSAITYMEDYVPTSVEDYGNGQLNIYLKRKDALDKPALYFIRVRPD